MKRFTWILLLISFLLAGCTVTPAQAENHWWGPYFTKCGSCHS